MKKGQIGVSSDMVGAGVMAVGFGAAISSVAPAAITGVSLPLDPAARGLIGVAAIGAGAGILAVKDLLK
jgi:hypothetical protein